MRKERKDEHIEQTLQVESPNETLLGDVYLENHSLPEFDPDEIDTTVSFCGKTVAFPLLINAMTGGTELAEDINQDLSLLAASLHLPMEVGSQRIALEDSSARASFEVVRSALGPEDVVLANLSARATVKEVREAMDMLHADAIGLHLNPVQESVMSEGERTFRGIRENIASLAVAFPGKLLVKEVGFGMSAQTVQALVDIGIRMIDISGSGGTNFIAIENARNAGEDYSDLVSWGVPTAKAILNARAVSEDIFLIASGGIRSAMDIVRALVLGADLCGISGELLHYLLMGGYDYAAHYLRGLIEHVKKIMLWLNCRTIEDLHHVPYRLTGRLREIAER